MRKAGDRLMSPDKTDRKLPPGRGPGGKATSGGGAFHAVLQGAGAVVAGANRLVDLADRGLGRGREVAVLERFVIFRLDIVLAALDFLDDRLVAARAGDRRAQVDPASMKVGLERAVVIRRAAERADSFLESCDALAPLGRVVTLVDFATPQNLIEAWGKNATYHFVFTRQNRGKLDELTALVERGLVRPTVGAVLPLEEIPAAHKLLEGGLGRAGIRGKIAIEVAP